MLKILIADTQPLFAECLGTALGMQPELEVLDERPDSGPAALAATVNRRPDILLMDYWMPEMGGPAAAALARSRVPTAVAVLSWLCGPREIRNALAAGAAAFIPKSLGIKELADNLRRVGSGERGVFPAEFKPLVSSGADLAEGVRMWDKLASLTDREIEIIRLLGRGYSKSTVAPVLKVSPETARTHIENIRRKLDARTQVEAVAITRQYGIIPP